MKKILISGLFFYLLTFSISSQSVYFDFGLGAGSAITEINGVDYSDSIGSAADETAVEFGLKLGFGPIAGSPFYIVGEFSGIGHRFQYADYYIQLNSYLLGPGVIFYPVPFIQLGASVGYSYVANQSDLPVTFLDSTGGIAGNVSAAIDLGRRNHGFLIGIKYSVTKNTLEISEVEQKTSLLSVFVKYAYRHKN